METALLSVFILQAGKKAFLLDILVCWTKEWSIEEPMLYLSVHHNHRMTLQRVAYWKTENYNRIIYLSYCS